VNFFTPEFIARIPDELIPPEELQDLNNQHGGKRRRSSIFEALLQRQLQDAGYIEREKIKGDKKKKKEEEKQEISVYACFLPEQSETGVIILVVKTILC